MFEPIALTSAITAAEIRDDLARLETERALAQLSGVAEIDSYRADLEEELEDCRHIYIAVAVTEIATLRGELFGRDVG